MRQGVKRAGDATEFETPERCSILEIANDPDDDVSISRARVRPGITTQWHRLAATDERISSPKVSAGWSFLALLRCKWLRETSSEYLKEQLSASPIRGVKTWSSFVCAILASVPRTTKLRSRSNCRRENWPSALIVQSATREASGQRRVRERVDDLCRPIAWLATLQRDWVAGRARGLVAPMDGATVRSPVGGCAVSRLAD